jgi:hypothetical protein
MLCSHVINSSSGREKCPELDYDVRVQLMRELRIDLVMLTRYDGMVIQVGIWCNDVGKLVHETIRTHLISTRWCSSTHHSLVYIISYR